MVAKGKTAPVKAQRTVAELEAELDRRTAERDAALAREAAMAEVLQVINASPGEHAPVFEAIVERAHSLCDAASGSLQLWDGDRFRGVRLCAAAKDGRILVSQRVAAGLDGGVALEEVGPLTLKGLSQPILAFNVSPA